LFTICGMQPLPLARLMTTYQAASRRLFLLDYDGTISDIKPTPAEAVPTSEILRLLAELSASAGNTLVIVSGRKHQELSDWLGHLPITLVAEHGFWVRQPGGGWRTAFAQDLSWQAEPRRLMEQAVMACPGSFIEDKSSGIVWHYRSVADQTAAEAHAAKLLAALRSFDTDIFRASHGAKIVEVQRQGVTKGEAIRPWLKQPGWDFIMIAGDDRTDEDMFAVAPSGAFTIKIGGGETKALSAVENPTAFRALLKMFEDR
jgi:trehalose 6-phosphate synthase/phosphatase